MKKMAICGTISGMETQAKTPEKANHPQTKIKQLEEQIQSLDQIIAEQTAKLKWYEEQLR